MSLRLAVDFDGDDWVGFCRATDAPNLFGQTGISVRRQANGSGASAADGTLLARYDSDRAKYGKWRLNFTMGGTLAVTLNIGYDGVSFDIGSQAVGTYTAVAWVKLTSGAPADTFVLRLYQQSGLTLRATSGSFTANSTTWTKVTVTGTTTAIGSMLMQIARTGGTTSQVMEIAGWMIVAGSTAPDWFNVGAASLLQDITDYWGGGRWGLGWVKQHQHLAPVGKADLKLINGDKRFSPEYSSGPLFGLLLPNLLVQIADPDYGIWWTGWVDEWKPKPRAAKGALATLAATDARRFLVKKLPVLPLYDSTYGGLAMIEDILGRFDVPNTTDTFEVSGSSPVYATVLQALESESPIVQYYADNVPHDHDAVKVLGDILGGSRYKAWFDREGILQVRSEISNASPTIATDLSELHMDADYGVGMIVNKCEVMGRKRKIQTSGGPFTVWELDETFTIDGSGTESFRIFFTHSNESKVLAGAGGTFAITETNSGVAGDITAALSDIGAQSAIITYTNNNAASRDVLTTTVTATTRVTQLREFSKETEDATSISANGLLGERLDYSSVQTRAAAKAYADYRIARFKDARFEMKSVDIDADVHPDEAYDSRIGTGVQIADDHVSHDESYVVIGEQHTVNDGLTDHTVTLYLETIYEP